MASSSDCVDKEEVVDLKFLRKSRGGHLSEVCKKYSIVDKGLSSSLPLSELEVKLRDYEDSFQRFMNSHESYLLEETDELKRVAAIDRYDIELDRKLNIEIAISKYAKPITARTSRRSKSSKRSSNSTQSSKCSNSSLKRLAAAKIRLESIEEKHTLEKALADNESEIKRKLELLEAKTELKIAEEFINIEEGSIIDVDPVQKQEDCLVASQVLYRDLNTSQVEPSPFTTSVINRGPEAQVTSINTCDEVTNIVSRTKDVDHNTHIHLSPIPAAIPKLYSANPFTRATNVPPGLNVEAAPWPSSNKVEPPLIGEGAPGYTPLSEVVMSKQTIREGSQVDKRLDSAMPPVPGISPMNQGTSEIHQSYHDSNSRMEPWLFIADAIRQGPSLPKIELLKFGGDPKDYIEFLKNFKSNVESQVVDESQRLIRLIAQCTGKAKETIRSCVNLPAHQGYKKALETLKENFGQEYMVADAYMKRLRDLELKSTDASTLMDFGRQLEDIYRALSSMGYNYCNRLNNEETLKLLMRKLPLESIKRKWAEKAGEIIMNNNVVKFEHFLNFVKRMGFLVNNIYGNELRTSVQRDRNQSGPRLPNRVSATTLALEATDQKDKGQKSLSCPKCHLKHGIWKCQQFKSGSYTQRLNDVRTFKLCMSCLSYGHFLRDCKMGFKCRVQDCNSLHHTLIHPPKEDSTGSSARKDEGYHSQEPKKIASNHEAAPEEDVGQRTTVGALTSSRPRVCFKIVPVRVRSKQGTEVKTYAFLDGGSDSTLCTQELVEKLDLQGSSINVEMETATGKKRIPSCKVQFEVSSLTDDVWYEFRRVLTTDVIPVHEGHIAKPDDLDLWPHLSDLVLPAVEEGEVSILIGNDHPELLEVQLDARHGGVGCPSAIKSPLGWSVCGPIAKINESGDVCINKVSAKEEIAISTQLQRMYDTEFGGSISEVEGFCSVEDAKAREHMKQTVCLQNGHYEIGLPFRNRNCKLPDSLPVAQRRLGSLKRRFEKNDEFKEQYCAVMKRYQEEGSAVQVTKSEHDQLSPQWYLPHHAVWHPRKPKEPRVVFDCAAKSGRVCLNDILLKGPDNTSSLLGVLLRFRLNEIGVAGDIRSMFHQVHVSPKDRGALSFLWWPEGDITKDPVTYTMTTHIFGAKSSPSVCGFALRKTAQDHESEFSPSTIDAVFKSYYVDDLLRSYTTEAEATQAIKELKSLLSKGGFNLTKFTSSSRNVLETVPKEERAAACKNLDLSKDELPTEKALGVQWDVEKDALVLTVGKKEFASTRRGLLSSIASIFDPLNFASPLLLPGRLINQELCKSKYGWDDSLPDDVVRRCQIWLEGLLQLKDFGFPRCYRPRDFGAIETVEIHHFSDASEKFGYGVASYLRFVNSDQRIHCSFLYGKSRVNPLKAGITVPKLELTAATVLVQSHKMLIRELGDCLHIDRVFFWTDSIIVMKYIRNEKKRFVPFVANRVAKIKEGSEISQWRHVRSEDNPADIASRGLKPDEKDRLHMWINGPSFLQLQEDEWPPQPDELSEELKDDEEGVKKEKCCAVNVLLTCYEQFWSSLFNRFSSWSKLRRVVAWIARVVAKWKCKALRTENSEIAAWDVDVLTVEELRNAEEKITLAVQRESFSEVAQSADKGIKGNLSKLKPFYQNGILHVGGRLNRSLLPFNFKHPMILPPHHVITRLLIIHYHERSGHSGSQHVLSLVRNRFWVINGLSTVRNVLHKCHVCRRENAKVGEQLTSPLPAIRVSSDAHRLIHPFAAVGIDLFGPLQTKKERVSRSSQGTTNKRYGCIFTCLRYRAVHLELVTDLSTESFINAFLRFVCRRGSPLIVYSDNGTNFRGAEKEVLQAMKTWDQQKISSTLAERMIAWKFNPPLASHQGGVWERIIRSIRRILHSMIRDHLVDDETLRTLLCEVEKILNDRPITRLSDDSKDEEALTPNHILLLRRNVAMPTRTFQDKEKFRGRWKYANILANNFWQRWVSEYLPTLQERQRWLKEKANFSVGDLVLVIDKSLPRGKWEKGIIQETYPDSDGLVRRVCVKTSTGILVRDIRKLCMLEEDVLRICEAEMDDRKKKKED